MAALLDGFEVLLDARRAAGESSKPAGQRATTQRPSQQPARPGLAARRGVAATAAVAGSSDADAGSSFLQQFKNLASLADAQPASTSGSGCCGGSGSAEGGAQESGSGCCGGGSGGGASASGQAAASAVMSQLSSMMGGMEGSLTRDDMRSAFEASHPASAPEGADGGERFLDLSAVLGGSHRADFADDHDDELDALVV
ncbi:expressed protein [Chlorella variabilis]|uniref:Expressed protein n=1 Tax=Chlorella variabilis TaxID=554065 RepID=E1ZM14_CHLVA|nr:expressed protein [Chlorella variabilis]EFN53031.1 expressed protein [Chlorella variabilis]|eukprot:XP_005845133.1 expressed protein [Chlorella variabilis]